MQPYGRLTKQWKSGYDIKKSTARQKHRTVKEEYSYSDYDDYVNNIWDPPEELEKVA